MSEHAKNLGRAARLLKRIADIGAPDEFEGVLIENIITDVLLAQNEAFMREAMDRVGLPDTNVIPFPDRHSMRVGA